MLRWLVLTFITLVAFDALKPWLRRLGLGRLPGDLNFRWLGREWSVPLGSTVLLVLIGEIIVRVLT